MVIVLAYADRPEGHAALERALQEAALRGAELLVLQAFQHTASGNPAQVRTHNEQLERSRQHGESVAGRIRGLGIAGNFEVLTSATDGPSKQLLRKVDDVGADLLIVGLRRRSSVGKLVLGSVAQDLLLGANCPVLTVKAPSS